MTDVPVDSPPTDQVRLVITDRSHDSINVARIYEVEVYDQVR